MTTLNPSSSVKKEPVAIVPDIPQEILLHILNFLNATEVSRVAQTSTLLNQVSSDASIWRKFILNLGASPNRKFYQQINSAVLLNVFLPRVNYECVNLCSALKAIPTPLIRTIADLCNTKLRYLDLSKRKDLSDEDLIYTVEHCPNLQHLLLEGNSRITDISLSSITKNCKALKELDITDCYKLTSLSFQTLAQLNQMQVLIANGCFLTDNDLRPLVSKHTLSVLNIKGCTKISDAFLVDFVCTVSKRLRSLNISETGITDNGLIALLRALGPNSLLESVNASHCKLMNGEKVLDFVFDNSTMFTKELKMFNLFEVEGVKIARMHEYKDKKKRLLPKVKMSFGTRAFAVYS